MKTLTPQSAKNKGKSQISNNNTILHNINYNNQVSLEESLVDLYLSVKIRKQEEVSY